MTNTSFLKRLMVLTFSLCAVSYALIYDYYAESTACRLCILERIPYLFVIVFCFIGIWSKINLDKLSCIFLGINLALSIYHSLVEFGLLHASCIKHIDFSQDINNIKNQIEHQRVSDCSKPTIIGFGISMAQANAILNAFLITIILSPSKAFKFNKNSAGLDDNN